MSAPAFVIQHDQIIRIVVHLAPNDRSVLEFEFHADETPIDQTGTTWACTLHDADTGELALEYTPTIDEELVTFTADDVTALDPESAYEARVVRTSPGPDTIAAGPVVFDAETYPVAA